jgi:hypothetical protein
VGLADLSGKVTPHALRYTAATWLMQRGVPVWEVAGFLGVQPGCFWRLMATITQTSFTALPMPSLPSTGFRWLTLKRSGKEAKRLMITWSEWQDLNLRTLRPERGEHLLSC